MKSRIILCGAMCALAAMPLNAAEISAMVSVSVENAAKQDVRKIAFVEAVNVESPVGTVLRLP